MYIMNFEGTIIRAELWSHMLCRRRWAEEGQYQALRAAVDEAMRLQLPPGVGQPPPRQVPGDRRPAEPEVRPSQAGVDLGLELVCDVPHNANMLA